jgi:integrase
VRKERGGFGNGSSKRKNFGRTPPEFLERYEKLKRELEVIAPRLSKQKLANLRAVLVREINKFRNPRIPKYGSLNKGFSEQEIQKFFRVIDSPKFKLLFSYQSQLGLRIGEAVRVNVKDINFESREITLRTEKAKTLDALLIPADLFKQTVAYIREHSNEIEKASGYLFFKDEGTFTRNATKHLDANYARNRFKYYIEEAGLDEVYDTSEEALTDRRPRKLHRLTTHSLRHYAITRFAEQTNGNIFLTSKFARHAKPDNTMTYISTNKKDLYESIDCAFSINQMKSLKNRINAMG